MLTEILSSQFVYAITWTLVHSVWQLIVIALLLAVILKLTPNRKADLRFGVGMFSLGMVLLTSLVTFCIYYSTGNGLSSDCNPDIVIQENDYASLMIIGHDYLSHYANVIFSGWFLGSLLFLLKFLVGWSYLKQITQEAHSVSGLAYPLIKKLNKKFKIHREILFKESARITTPMVVGYLKPIILFPIGLINQLSTTEVEAIISHEMGHIKRHDILFNLILAFAEIIFYFHPAIWLISAIIRRERENACDDLAIKHGSNKVVYAKTLIKLQELGHHGLEPALGFAGKKSHFSNRVKRLISVKQTQNNNPLRITMSVVVCLTLFGFIQKEEPCPEQEESITTPDIYFIDDCPQDIGDIAFYLDTIPERNNFHIQKTADNKNLELRVEEGEIVTLKIDGRTILPSQYSQLDKIIQQLIPTKDKEVITVFPDCGNSFGHIFYLSKDRRVIELDSLLKSVDSQKLTDQKLDKNNFHLQFDNNKDWVDSIQQTVKIISNNQTAFQPDSLMDFMPHRIPDFHALLDSRAADILLDRNLTEKNH